MKQRNKWLVAVLILLSVPLITHAETEIELRPLVSFQYTNLQSVGVVGGTFQWKFISFDLAQGAKTLNCNGCLWSSDIQSATVLATRIYPFSSQRIRPFLMHHHTSDIFRGPPFNKNKDEPTIDYFALGITVVATKNLELDFSFGRQLLDCGYFKDRPCHRSDAGYISFRWYPIKTFIFKLGE